MCSMCLYCGAVLSKSENGEKQKKESSLKLNGDPYGSCKYCLRQNGLTPFGTPLISPATSLSSSDRSFSSCSEFSVDGISYERANQEPCTAETRKEDGNWMSGRLKNSTLTCPGNGTDNSDSIKGKSNSGSDDEIVRDVEIIQNGNAKAEKSDETSLASPNEEHTNSCPDDDQLGAQFWDPPEPDDPDDDLEGSVAYNDEDDESCEGAEWGKPNSLSHYQDEGSQSYNFNADKEREMEEVINGKLKRIVSQLLKVVGGLPSQRDGEKWLDIVTSLSWEAASFVKPVAINGKPMDPDGCVKVKCIATGSCSESHVFRGLVFKKHAAHKHMRTKYKNAKLLLIRGELGQSSSGLSSFKAMEQEKDHLKSVIERIELSHPDVVLVEKNVSRDVQESILAKGMTLVYDMKLHRLERVARCTGSQILSSETMAGQKLKQCHSFHIEKFVEELAPFGEGGKQSSKTLMFLEGCPTRLGCTVLLKGSQSDELKRIKYVVQCAVVMAYHLILETSFLIDQKAMLCTTQVSGVAEALPTDRPSPDFRAGSSSTHFSDESTTETGLSTFEIPVSSGLCEESSSFKGPEGDKLVKDALDGNAALSYEPYNPVILTGLSSLSASLKKVIGNTFPVPSATSYRSLSSYFGLTGGEQVDVPISGSVPVLRVSEVSNGGDVEAKCTLDPEEPVDGLLSSTSVDTEAVKDIRIESGNKEDHMRSDEESSVTFDSQSILVLMSSRNALRGTICEQNHFSHIMFYKKFDVPLGNFLRGNLLNQKMRCKTCGELPESHFYYYAHHNRQLTIQVKRIPADKKLPGEAEGKLWMWSCCRRCRTANGASKSTKRVLISTPSCGLSFGKFLELSFCYSSSSSQFANCGHSLDKDFFYFFGFGSMVAMFKFSKVTIYSVSLPPQKMEFNDSIKLDWLKEEVEDVYTKGILLFREIESSLKQMRSKFIGSRLNLQGVHKDFLDVEEMLKKETSDFEASIHSLVAKNKNQDEGFHILLRLNRVRWELLLESCIWDRRLHSLLLPYPTLVVTREDEKFSSEHCSSTPAGNGETLPNLEDGARVSTSPCDLEIIFDAPAESNTILVKEIPGSHHIMDTVEQDVPISTESIASTSHHSDDENSQGNRIILSGHPQVHKIIPPTTESENISFVSDSNESGKGKSSCSLLSSLEKSNGWFWMPFSEIQLMQMKDLQRGYLPKFESVSDYTKQQLSTAYQTITEEGSRLHIPLGNDDFIVSDYEGELSSLISCALALVKDLPVPAEIPEDMTESRLTTKTGSLENLTRIPTVTSLHWSRSGSFDSDSVHSTVNIFTEESRFSSFDGLNLLDSLSPPEGLNIEVSLGAGKSLGKGKYSVICLYANQFRNLRNRCCPSEIDYIASLSRCQNWDAKGGKTKSFFAKTLDDRFIIKEIKKAEYDSFEKFAPQYFKYMNQSFDSDNQTCLAKVVGIYQVIIRQSKGTKEMNLMVMENLTFGQTVSRQYDLKGALHARYNSTVDVEGDVLLDQNFVNDMNSSPFYVSLTCKRRLERAVWNDTNFLNSINVMDYSLLVGVDAQRQVVVCGIIDYLRQYTWDKQLETWVKSSLVVPKNVLPTIISPKEYKKRFRKFMSRHFLCVPDSWCPARDDPPTLGVAMVKSHKAR